MKTNENTMGLRKCTFLVDNPEYLEYREKSYEKRKALPEPERYVRVDGVFHRWAEHNFGGGDEAVAVVEDMDGKIHIKYAGTIQFAERTTVKENTTEITCAKYFSADSSSWLAHQINKFLVDNTIVDVMGVNYFNLEAKRYGDDTLGAIVICKVVVSE